MRDLGLRLVFVMIGLTAVVTVACSSDGDDAPPSPTVAGTVPPAGLPLDTILTEQLTQLNDPVFVAQVYSDAYTAHPDAATVPVLEGGEMFPVNYADNNLNICQFGSPPFGDIPVVRGGGCMSLTWGLLSIYGVTGYGEFYQAAVTAWNFARTTVPTEQATMEGNIRNLLARRNPTSQ